MQGALVLAKLSAQRAQGNRLVPGDCFENFERARERLTIIIPVTIVMRQIGERSPILAEMIRDGRVGLAGGLHDLDSGRVAFFE